jgi:alcohol dehydrogenase
MKAILFKQHGGPDVLQYADVPDPKPRAREVVIQVKAAGCNYNDLWARQGLPGMKFELPHISGSDAAGVVTEVGSDVTAVKVGQEVVVHPSMSCRICAMCTRGQEYFCRYFKIWGFQTGPLDGAHAELARLPEANVVPKPANLTWEEAASIPLVLLTSWHMLVARARLAPGEDVLIWGAGSGIGSVAIQIAKVMGARVIAVAGTDEKLAKARTLGADDVVNHAKQDVLAEVRKLTGRKGVEVVFEHVGEATWERSVAAMAWGGRLVICGNTTGFEAKTDLRFLFNKQLSLLGSHQGTKAELLEALRLVETGRIRAVVDRALPLRECAEAQRLMESRAHFGKLVLVP